MEEDKDQEEQVDTEKVKEIQDKYANPVEPGSLGSLKNFLRHSKWSDRQLVVKTIKGIPTYSTHRQGKNQGQIRRKTYPLWRGDILGNMNTRLSHAKTSFYILYYILIQLQISLK